MARADGRPRPRRPRWWARRSLLITDFGLPAPEIGSAAYRDQLEARLRTAIAGGAVDLGTGDMFDAVIEADRRTDQCRLVDEASRWHTHAKAIVLRHRRRRDHAARRHEDLAAELAKEQDKLAALDVLLAERRDRLPPHHREKPVPPPRPGEVLA